MLNRFQAENIIACTLVFWGTALLFPLPTNLLGALAVFLSFSRMQVGIYLAKGLKIDNNLESLFGWPAEICWTIYFLLMHCYPALIGVGINVGYRIYMSKSLEPK